MTTPIVVPSKLEIPVPRNGTFDRPRLVDMLDAVEASTLRAIIAPAGWGKTQLLGHWLARHHQPIAFVELDPLDNDPSHCWTHLLTAIGTAGEIEVADLIDQLRAPVLPLIPEIVEPAIARLGNRAFTLVLDDFHLIRNQEVQESIEALLDKRASVMGACIVSRTEPPLHLPRRRVRNQLIEVRTDELRMDAGEGAALLNEATGAELDSELVDQLVDRTEGWAAGLYLAGLSMRSTGDHRRFVAEFAGADRNLSEYLASEVLASLDEPDREFLLGIAVLDDLQPDVCNSLLDRDDAAARLEEFSRSNLFLVRTDQNNSRFRFHHLFKEWLEVLLAQTKPDAVADAHRRASRAYATQRDGVRAIDHALAAGDWPAAHRLLMRFGLAQIDAGNHHTVARWCGAFPPNLAPSIRFDVAAMRGWTAIIDGDLDAVDRYCHLADATLEHASTGDPPIMSPGDIPLIRGYRQLLSGSLDTIGDTITAAYQVGISERTEATLRWLRAAADYWLGEPDDQAFIDAAGFANGQGDPYATALSNAYLAHIHLDRNETAEAERWIERSFAVVTEHGLANFGYAALPHLARGRTALGAGDLERAERECLRAIELAGRRNDILVETLGRIIKAEVHHTNDNRIGARVDLQVASEDLALIPNPGMLAQRLQVIERQLRVRPQRRTDPVLEAPVEDLTDREITLLRLLPGSLSQRELGEALHLSFNTVKTYNRQIYRKLGVASRDDAVTAARKFGLL